jgi:hypothetical protein
VDDLERQLRETWPNLSQAEIDAIKRRNEGRWPKPQIQTDKDLEQRLHEVWPDLSQAEIDIIKYVNDINEGRCPKPKKARNPKEARLSAQQLEDARRRREEWDEASAIIARWMAKGQGSPLIYFIQAGYGYGAVKIGFTAYGAKRRLAELQTGSPNVLHILNTLPGTEADERKLHNILTEHRLKGEWFKPEPVVLKVAMSTSITEAIAIAEGN